MAGIDGLIGERARRDEETGWVEKRVLIPRSMAAELNEALDLANVLNDADGMVAPSERVRELNALGRVVIDFLIDARPLVEAYLSALKGYQLACYRVLIRDRYRCFLCWSSRAVQVHHVVPRSYHGPERPADIHEPSNLVTLCARCHDLVHHGSGLTWRDVRAKIAQTRATEPNAGRISSKTTEIMEESAQ